MPLKHFRISLLLNNTMCMCLTTSSLRHIHIYQKLNVFSSLLNDEIVTQNDIR